MALTVQFRETFDAGLLNATLLDKTAVQLDAPLRAVNGETDLASAERPPRPG